MFDPHAIFNFARHDKLITAPPFVRKIGLSRLPGQGRKSACNGPCTPSRERANARDFEWQVVEGSATFAEARRAAAFVYDTELEFAVKREGQSSGAVRWLRPKKFRDPCPGPGPTNTAFQLPLQARRPPCSEEQRP